MNHHQVITWDAPGMPSVQVMFDQKGDLVQVGPAGAEPWLTQWCAEVIGPGTGGARRTHPEVTFEADEVEQRWEVPGTELVVRLRHTFDRTWQTRLVVRNNGSETVPARVRWRMQAAPTAAAGAHAAGGYATVRVAGSTPGAPVLQATLAQGQVGPGLGSHMMSPPGGTCVTTWKVDWVSREAEVPLPVWWPQDQAAEDEPVTIGSSDLVVSPGTPREDGWEIPASAGVRRVEVSEATRVSIVEVLGVPAPGSLGTRIRRHNMGRDELSPAEALAEVLLDSRDGLDNGAIARLRVGTDEPGLRRILALHDPAGPSAGADTEAPGFGHGLATLHALPFGLAPTTVPVPPPEDPVARADALLTSAPTAAWDEVMAQLAPVVGAWPVQPLGWSLVQLSRWVAVATMARHLGRPGVPDPEPLRRAVLARCHDMGDAHLADPLVWLLLA